MARGGAPAENESGTLYNVNWQKDIPQNPVDCDKIWYALS